MLNRPSAPLKIERGVSEDSRQTFRRRNERVDRGGPVDTLTLPELRDAAESWLLDGEARLSKKTVTDRRFLLTKLLWWLEREGHRECGKREIQRFLAYVRTAHESPGGRWGTEDQPATDPRAFQPPRSQTVGNYFRWLRTFFLYLVEDGTLDASPLRTMKGPTQKQDQIQPFTSDQIAALLKAARQTRQPRRDEALLLLLLDTGARAAEVCGLRYRDFDLRERSIRVRGKGDMYRTLYLTAPTVKAIVVYLRGQQRRDEDPLFVAHGGHSVGQGMHPDGLGNCIRRLGELAGLRDQVRCSPHTFRHTFAIEFLRNGGDPLTLQSLYGHSDLEMTRRYVAIAAVDRKRKHGQFSPVAHLKRPR